MDLLLLAIALLVLLAAGFGIALLALPERRLGVGETFAMAFLFGCAFVSLASFCLGFFFAGGLLRGASTAACLVIAALGLRARREGLRELVWPRFERRLDQWSLLVVSAQMMVVTLACYYIWLGWDALLIWEFKARIAFLNGGALPLDYYPNPNGIWPHTSYPLLLPLTEAWFYGWLGRPDQALAKLLFPLFYLAALALLGTGVARFGQRRHAWPAMAALFLVPLAWLGEGSASSGYADFPLAVFQLAAVLYLLEYWEQDTAGALRTMSAAAAALIWVKQEGVILWSCLALLAAIRALQRREPRELCLALLPGALLFGLWRLFLDVVAAPRWTDFQRTPLRTLFASANLAMEIGRGVGSEFLRLNRFGVLWPGFLGALVLQLRGPLRPARAILSLSVLLPIVCYSGVYLFSNWGSVSSHIASSFSRLLLHVAPSALLLIVLSMPAPFRRKETRASRLEQKN
ncbi:MAG: hypothetical protein SF339_05270 [Blastocatellia bacterium]|nr:hypothetical protein [Blastocatellia bacterium]